MLSVLRCFTLVMLALLSLLAYADPTPVIIQTQNALKTSHQASPITQLEAASQQLQNALTTLQQRSKQLQNNLDALNRQITQSQTTSPKQALSSEESSQQLQQLRHDYQQAQDALMTLRQQEMELQVRMLALTQQLTQLSQVPLSLGTNTPVPSSVAHPVTPSNGPTAVPISLPNTSSPEPIVPSSVTTPSDKPQAPEATKDQTTAATDLDNSTPATQTEAKLTTESAAPTTTQAIEKKSETKQTETSFIARWMQDPAMLLRMGGGFVVVALFLLILLCWPKSTRSKTRSTDQELGTKDVVLSTAEPLETDEQTDLLPEYDFMSTDDAIPTRLDLARGYLAMHKYQEAREAIEPVLTKGDATQQQQAKDLLQQIAAAEAATL